MNVKPLRPDHDEMTDRRLTSVLAIIREENYRRAGRVVSPAQSRAWAMSKDPGVHTVINCNLRRRMVGGIGG